MKKSSSTTEYDQEMPQSHTTDQPTAPRGKALKDYESQDIRKTINAC